MSICAVTSFLLLLHLSTTAVTTTASVDPIHLARTGVSKAKNWVQSSLTQASLVSSGDGGGEVKYIGVALSECHKLYNESEFRLNLLASGEDYFSHDDVHTWLSGVLVNHRTCLDGLGHNGFGFGHGEVHNFTLLLNQALDLYVSGVDKRNGMARPRKSNPINGGILASWNVATSRADFTVAKDGSGTHPTINEAVAAVERMGRQRPERVIIYVKAGVYNEKVEIGFHLKNLMFVGDGMDRTIVTGNWNVPDGATTASSATFGVSGDGFWARDMTFENAAGPQKHQAVALRVSSDLAVFYRCGIRGYQDTLYALSLRQFYRDCHISGTIDFIFGDAVAMFQNCDILVRRPMNHQANMITAQGRENPNENTGISILESRISPAPDLNVVKGSIKSYLGRPWKKYSRTVIMKTDLDDLIHPKGWMEWSGDFAISTLFYGEYMNTGRGAVTENRVRWPGFHVLSSPPEASPFSVGNFIQGDVWIPVTGVPFSVEI